MLPSVHAPLSLPEVQGRPPAPPPLPDFAHRQPYAAYFDGLSCGPDAAAALRRLIPHLDADLAGGERLALWQALWLCAQRLGDTPCRRLAACLDGRHAAKLQPLQRPWGDLALVEHLARCTPPGAAQAGFVPELLAHQGLDPLARPESATPGLLLLAARAALHAATPRLTAVRIGQLQQAALALAERDPALLPQALALLFELALQAADEATATAVLAELLNHGQAVALRPDRVRAWLDGTAFDDAADAARPLLLAPALQRDWLQPAGWIRRPVLQALHDAVQRPAVRARLLTLARLLAADDSAMVAPAPANDGLQALRALDTAWLLLDQGGDAVPVIQALMQPDTLAPATIAALHAGSARWHAARGDTENQALALLQARRQQATPALRQALAALLPGPAPAFGADWREEEPYWTGLLGHAEPAWQRLAAFQLARLCTDGYLEPQPPRRCQDLPRAHALWSLLAAQPHHPALAAMATAALRHPAQTLLRPALRQHGDTPYLWIESPGARGVTIVFSCIATHHSFAEVAALRGRLPGQHLLFVRCPDKDWYCDHSFDSVRDLLRTQVQDRFAADEVTCWYGSMGGHGALKFGLEFGWRAITFNPQTDLDLWAAFRPRERALLWGAERHARLRDWPLSAWQRAPLYLACGAATADREALSVVIDRLRRCDQATAVIEKFADDNHAGLMNRIAGGAVAPVLALITRRLKALEAAPPAAGAQVLDGPAQATFWDNLDGARALKVELQVRDGRLWWQPSMACGTRP